LSSKRTFNQVPAKAALVLTGSAIALASYLGASSNDAGHEGRGARHTGLAAALTASHQAQATGTINAGASGLGTGLESSGTSGSAPIALAAYGTTDKHPRPPLRYAKHHQKRYPKRHPKHPEKHHAVKHHHAKKAKKHPARRHPGRLHGNPWQIAGSLMPAYHWTS
jgi:hypothetical protein